MPVDLTIPCFIVLGLAIAFGFAAGAGAARIAPESIRGIVAVLVGIAAFAGFLGLALGWSLHH